jgi:two-component system OmpR family sensor kinase
MTIRLRMTAWYAVVCVLTLLIVGIVVWLQYSAALRRSVDEVLASRAGTTVDLLEADPAARPDAAELERGLFLIVYGPTGAVTYASPRAPVMAEPKVGPSTVAPGGPQDASGEALYAQQAGGGRVVVAGTTLADVDRSLASLARTMALVGMVGGLLSILGGYWLAGRALAPVARLTSEADAIGSDEVGRRLEESTRRDELGDLARTLNRMLARVEGSAGRQRAFVIGASHDLRTPLAALRTELELALLQPSDEAALRSAVEGAHADAVRLSDLANGLLRLAAAEADGRPLERETVDLRGLLAEAVELVPDPSSAQPVDIAIEAEDATIRVDRPRLEQAVMNLVANATRFAPGGTSVEVVAGIDPERVPPVLRVEVLDRGPGVAAELRDSLFQPFSRARRPGADGTGLGLATAAAAVHAHGGAIGYDDRVGGGARFWMWVPV